MPVSAGQVANTWSGTWVNSAPDGTFWVFSQSGDSVGGVWKGSGSSGSLSGTIQGSTLSGTLVNNEANQSASFSITLATDGHAFSGTFTISGGSTGQWRSACTAGGCLNNAAPPPPPPVVPPGAGSPATPRLLAAAAAWGQLGPATVLEPGGEAIATSPPIAPGQRRARVTVSGDVSGETAIVIGEPTRRRRGGRITPGDCVRAGLGKLAGLAESRRIESLPELNASEVTYHYTMFMLVCLDFIKQVEKQAQPAALTPAPRAAQVSCRLSARALTMRVDRAARTLVYGPRRASRRKPVRLLRGSCRKTRDGTVTLNIRTRSRRTKLRSVLGPRLVVGLYRSAGASGTATVRTTFKRR